MCMYIRIIHHSYSCANDKNICPFDNSFNEDVHSYLPLLESESYLKRIQDRVLIVA